MTEVETLLDKVRGRADALVARRFACSCVCRIWAQVQAQAYVPAETIQQCCRAFELTERSLVGPVADQDLQAIDFEVITDAGDAAFMAAAHVGWNLFAPVNGLHAIDEFDNAREIAMLVAQVGGTEEYNQQIRALHQILADEAGEPGLQAIPPDPGSGDT